MLAQRPVSATRGWIVLVGFVAFVASLFLARHSFMLDPVKGAALVILITAATHFFLDVTVLKVHRRTSTGLDWTKKNSSFDRVQTKIFGFAGSLGFIGAIYWLFPEYRGDFYDSYWSILRLTLPVVGLLAIPYIWFVDSRMENPNDGYVQMGRVVLFQWEKIDKAVLGQHMLGWLVKGFFLPLMFTYFVRDLAEFSTFDFSIITDFKTFFDFTYHSIFLVDVGIVSMGYVMSLRLFDTHLRSTEPTFKGWLVALICYQPFWSLFGRLYLDYSSDFGWGVWLQAYPAMYAIWGSLILLLYAVYVTSSLMFGCRFSNLTHRGILTNGPYAWSKHPAYISKNIAWWLTSVPFAMSGSGADALRGCALLALINYVYYLRAKTEEAHLARDPVYREYTAWIAERGLIARLRNRFGD
ncbi:MAG: isoprenylcysteine carboxylmethyltransferase family protein [Bdellovibrionota bacterium]